MAHSVEEHLGMRASEYDRVIRTFIPGYETMLATQLRWLATTLPETGLVVDLGGGTGALAQAVAERFPRVHIQVWDTDPQMLAVAEQRLRRYGDRVALVQRTFYEPLPEAHAFVASLALHHIRGGVFARVGGVHGKRRDLPGGGEAPLRRLGQGGPVLLDNRRINHAGRGWL